MQHSRERSSPPPAASPSRAFRQLRRSRPHQPIRLVVGFPGGSTLPDITARTIAEPLAELLGKPVVVDNNRALPATSRPTRWPRPPTTTRWASSSTATSTSSKMLYPTLPYDPAKDFTYLSLIATAAGADRRQRPAFGARRSSVTKASGDKWNYGSVGVDSVGHLGMELIKSRIPGLAAQHVPYTETTTGRDRDGQRPTSDGTGAAGHPRFRRSRPARVKAIGLTGGRDTLAPDYHFRPSPTSA